jgi:hypothetical protein
MLMSQASRIARLRYLPNNFQVLSPGDHVVCAVSGTRVALDELRYWSVQRQEAYATAQIAVDAALAH